MDLFVSGRKGLPEESLGEEGEAEAPSQPSHVDNGSAPRGYPPKELFPEIDGKPGSGFEELPSTPLACPPLGTE